MKQKMQLKPKVAPSVKVSATTLIYVAGGIILASVIGILLFIKLNLGNTITSLAAPPGNFVSTATGDWTSNTSWQGGTAPGSALGGNDVTISASNSITHTGDITGDNGVVLNIEANATLTIDGDLIIKNDFILNNSGTLIITGSLIGKNGANVTINGGGSMKVGNNITFDNNTSLVVNGSLNVGGDVSFGNNGVFNGTGTVNIVGNGCSDWTGATPCQSQSFVLPVKLLSFKASDDQDGTVKVSWSTAAEKNNDYFTIQVSTDGITWNELLMVKGKGTTEEVSHYTIQDPQPAAERLYYRLTQTDFDGTTETFAPVFVEVALITAQLAAYPNPMTGNNLTISLPKAEAGSIQVLDNRGKLILSRATDGSSNVVDLEFTGELLQGLYYINYKSASGLAQSLKIVKK